MDNKKCLQCGILYKKSKKGILNKKYCSLLCRRKATRIEKQCVVCKKSFTVTIAISNQIKCCSRQCSLIYRKSLEYRKHLCKIQKERVKNGLHNLYRGITKENELARKSFEYKQWRNAVFERDDFTCQECCIRGGNLNADHIKPFAVFLEKRYEVENGRTLCVSCHRKTNTWGVRLGINLLEV